MTTDFANPKPYRLYIHRPTDGAPLVTHWLDYATDDEVMAAGRELLRDMPELIGFSVTFAGEVVVMRIRPRGERP